jgi:hypothetical protein
MDYYQKYFKYKLRYISLKGGIAPPIELNNTLDFFTKRLNDHDINFDFKLSDFGAKTTKSVI